MVCGRRLSSLRLNLIGLGLRGSFFLKYNPQKGEKREGLLTRPNRGGGRRARDVPARLWRREPPMTTRAARAARAPPAVIRAGEGSLRTDNPKRRRERRTTTGDRSRALYLSAG